MTKNYALIVLVLVALALLAAVVDASSQASTSEHGCYLSSWTVNCAQNFDRQIPTAQSEVGTTKRALEDDNRRIAAAEAQKSPTSPMIAIIGVVGGIAVVAAVKRSQKR
jgi:hypothetical protein